MPKSSKPSTKARAARIAKQRENTLTNGSPPEFLRALAKYDYIPGHSVYPSTGLPRRRLKEIADTLERHDSIAIERNSKYEELQQIGKSCAESLAEMVAALNCDYDRLEELRGDLKEADDDLANGSCKYETSELDEMRSERANLEKEAGDCESRNDAEQRIHEDPLSIELTGTWTPGETPVADRALILLGTGGPAVRIVCELNDRLEPHRAWIEAQDWFQPWTEYRGDAISQNDLLAYCRCFYFGE